MDSTSTGPALAGIACSTFLADHIVRNVLTATCVLRAAPLQVHRCLVDIRNQVEGSRWWAWGKKKQTVTPRTEILLDPFRVYIIFSPALGEKEGPFGKASKRQRKLTKNRSINPHLPPPSPPGCTFPLPGFPARLLVLPPLLVLIPPPAPPGAGLRCSCVLPGLRGSHRSPHAG